MSGLSVFSDEHFMRQAITEAEQAMDLGEIPVGAVIVSGTRIIAKAHNQVEQLQDVTAHAEMLAITAAQNYLGSHYLTDCTLYVTLEPCTMCAGALFWSQISRLVIAAQDEARGFMRLKPKVLHPKTKFEFGLLEHESQTLIKEFFKKMRRTN